MGLERTHGRNYDLSRLLGAIDEGEIVLPEFQRDFLWDTSAVKQLLATCLTGWPIGSLLLLPGKSKIFFRTREIEGAPPVRDAFQLVVLDGQQRLTSLYQALYAKGDFRYGIRFGQLSPNQTIEELEDAIVSIPSEKWKRSYKDARSEFDANLMPVSVLRRASDFFAWRDRAVRETEVPEKERLTDLYVELLSGLDRYEIPAVVIDDDVHPEAVARIFERVNRLGQPLGTFDLMVAKSFNTDFNLREEWDHAQERFPRLGEFLNGDGLPVLTVISLHVRESVRQHDVLALTGAEVRDYWQRSVEALESAIAYVESRLGVWQADWLPYKVQISVLGSFALEKDLGSYRHEIDGWFWNSVFRSRYDVASNTRAVADYRALLAGKLTYVGDLHLDPEILLAVNRRQYGALHRGLLCLFATVDPLDPIDATPLSPDHASEYAGVAPISFAPTLSDPRSTGRQPTIATLLSNQRASRTSRSINLAELAPEVLESQLLPSEVHSMGNDEILSVRLQKIARQIELVSGTHTLVVPTAEGLIDS